MVRVKICGITRMEDAQLASVLGAWAIGFILYKKSLRYVKPEKIRKIIKNLPPFITPVGVFVNEEENNIRQIAEFCGLKALQFHGEETPQFCSRFSSYKIIKAFRIKGQNELQQLSAFRINAYLLDAYQEGLYGGSGRSLEWKILKGIKNIRVPIIIAGGLNEKNIDQVLKVYQPYALDLSSGVEVSPGIKDHRALKRLFKKVCCKCRTPNSELENNPLLENSMSEVFHPGGKYFPSKKHF